jgi:hypothetical protein
MKAARTLLIVISLIVISFSILIAYLPKGNNQIQFEKDQKSVEQFQKAGSPANKFNSNIEYNNKK